MFLFLTLRYYEDEISRRQTKKPFLHVLFYTYFLKQRKKEKNEKSFYFVNLLNLLQFMELFFSLRILILVFMESHYHRFVFVTPNTKERKYILFLPGWESFTKFFKCAVLGMLEIC